MGENGTTFGGYGFIVFIVLMFWLFLGGFGGNGFGNRNNCGCVSNCDVERREIIDAATTQFKVVDSARQTQDMLGNKIDFYAYQDLRDQLNQERTKNVVLENRIYSDGQFNALSRQNEAMYNKLGSDIAELACNVPKRPPYYAQGFICCGQPIPQGCGCYGC